MGRVRVPKALAARSDWQFLGQCFRSGCLCCSPAARGISRLGRKDVLSGVFFMLTLWVYACYARSDQPSPGQYVLTLVLFALGLMCKPTLVTLPFVLLLLEYWPLGRSSPRRIRPLADQKAEVRGQKSQKWFALIIEKIPFFVLFGCVKCGDGSGAGTRFDRCRRTAVHGARWQRGGLLCRVFGSNDLHGAPDGLVSLSARQSPHY